VTLETAALGMNQSRSELSLEVSTSNIDFYIEFKSDCNIERHSRFHAITVQ